MALRLNLLLAMALAMPTTAHAAYVDIIVWLEPANASVAVGELTTIDIMASFPDPVAAWGLDLGIGTPGFATWTGTTLGGSWEETGGTMDLDGLGGIRFGTGVSGDVLLATVTFEGLMPGATDLILSSGPEEDEGFLLDTGVVATNVTFESGMLTVIPEPTTLVGFFVFALVGLRRRR